MTPFDTAPFLAYIDPGSGAIILQALLAGVAGAIVFFKYQGKRFLAFLGVRRKEEPGGDGDPS